MRYGVLAHALFLTMDLLYGRTRHLSKFKVLEVIARVPYQAWEHVAYIAITHMHPRPDFARRIFERVKESRLQQDNEQWHLLILEELTDRKGIREGFVRYRLVPQLIAFVYYHISWLLYVLRPRWSYLLNAWFEDHAEPFEGIFADDYGHFASLAHLFRQVAYDERVHKFESLERVATARFE